MFSWAIHHLFRLAGSTVNLPFGISATLHQTLMSNRCGQKCEVYSCPAGQIATTEYQKGKASQQYSTLRGRSYKSAWEEQRIERKQDKNLKKKKYMRFLGEWEDWRGVRCNEQKPPLKTKIHTKTWNQVISDKNPPTAMDWEFSFHLTFKIFYMSITKKNYES